MLKIIQGNDFFLKRAIRWFGPRCSSSPSWVDSTCFGLNVFSKEPSLCFGDYCVFIQIHHHKELMKFIKCHRIWDHSYLCWWSNTLWETLIRLWLQCLLYFYLQGARKLLQFLPLGIDMDNLMLESMFKVCSLTCKDVYMFHTF